MPCHGTINLNNDPGLFGHTKEALKGFLAQQIKEENPLFDHPQLHLDIEAVNKATITACQYVDWLLSTINPNAPQRHTDNTRYTVHPRQKLYKDVPEADSDFDCVDLLSIVQSHICCSTSYCLRKK